MKDFKLNVLKNDSKKTLTRAEMKAIVGGDDCGNNGGPCDYDTGCGLRGYCINGHCTISVGQTSCEQNNGGCPTSWTCMENTSYGTICAHP